MASKRTIVLHYDEEAKRFHKEPTKTASGYWTSAVAFAEMEAAFGRRAIDYWNSLRGRKRAVKENLCLNPECPMEMGEEMNLDPWSMDFSTP